MICDTVFDYGCRVAIKDVEPVNDGTSYKVLVFDRCLHRMVTVCIDEPLNIATVIYEYWHQAEPITKIFNCKE